jgi:hypothetical protein
MSNYIKENFDLQEISSYILNDFVSEKRHPITTCQKFFNAPGDPNSKSPVTVKQNKSGNPYYSGLQTCGSVWVCPVCAKKITEVRRQEIEKAIENHSGSILMVTFTIPHNKKDSLLDSYNLLMRARREMKKQSSVKRRNKRPLIYTFSEIAESFDFLGDIASVEITYSDNNGFHPHCHSLFLFNQTLNQAQITKIEYYLRYAYLDSLIKKCKLDYTDQESLFNRALKVDQIKNLKEYITKASTQDKSEAEINKIAECYQNRWKYSEELTKQHIKKGKSESLTPFDFLRVLNKVKDAKIYKKYASLFVEYYKATFGRRQIFWGKAFNKDMGLKEYFKINHVSDEEIADGDYEKEDERLGYVENDEFKFLRENKLRGDFLQWIKNTNFTEAKEYLKGVMYEKEQQKQKKRFEKIDSEVKPRRTENYIQCPC